MIILEKGVRTDEVPGHQRTPNMVNIFEQEEREVSRNWH